MWIVCQIGAREHYAIPRALHAAGQLSAMITDFWVAPGSVFSRLPGGRRLSDRFHADLAEAPVHAPNARMLAFELKQRLADRGGWDAIIARNALFQQWAVRELEAWAKDQGPRTAAQAKDPANHSRSAPLGTSGTARRSVPTVFSYSYAARDLFRFAKARGWRTVLGQIDPGPEEERIVAEEQQRYPHLGSAWHPAPPEYWEIWREELELADRIIVNSEWSRQCLLKEGVAEEKLEIVPLVYVDRPWSAPSARPWSLVELGRSEALHQHRADTTHDSVREPFAMIDQGPRTAAQRPEQGPRTHLLFLGQIILRKGIGRLLDAMRLLRDEPVELILAGPSEIDPAAWADLPKVRWLGPVPRSEVGRIYQEADVFILPTLSDGYALTQLEALSHGLPVIASKHCGEAVIHGRNGWILDDLEPETIAAAIRVAMHEHPPDIRPPEFLLEDLVAALNG